MFFEAIECAPPFGFSLLARFVYVFEALRSSVSEVLRPAAHGRLRRFPNLLFFFSTCDRAIDAAYAASATASSSVRSPVLKNRRTSAAAGRGRSRNALVETLTEPDILRKRP